jgi:hypothetical protein
LNSDNAERYVYKNNECRLLFQENKISGDWYTRRSFFVFLNITFDILMEIIRYIGHTVLVIVEGYIIER